MKPQPVHVDALLYIGIAIFGYLATQLASDEAGKFCALWLLFYLKTANGTFLASCTALKLFRSNSYSDYLKKKENGNGNGNGAAPHAADPGQS